MGLRILLSCFFIVFAEANIPFFYKIDTDRIVKGMGFLK